MKRSPSVKRCHVTVEGRTITVSAVSAYFAAMAYNAEAGCPSPNPLPVLTDSTVLRVREVGQRRIYSVVWREVIEWANREADVAFELLTESSAATTGGPASGLRAAFGMPRPFGSPKPVGSPSEEARDNQRRDANNNGTRTFFWRTALANNF